MTSKVLIFDDPDDFLKCMEELQREHNKQHENHTIFRKGKLEIITKEIKGINQVRTEYTFLWGCKINTFTGYLKNYTIMVNFNHNGETYLYKYIVSDKWLYYKFRWA